MRLQLLLALLTACLSAGCSSRHSTPQIVADTVSPTASPAPKDDAAPTLVLSPSGARFGASPDLLAVLDPGGNGGFDAALKKDGKNGLYLLPLGKALEDARAQKRLTDTLSLTIDPKTPFRAVMEAFYTAGQNEIGSFQVTEARLEKPRSFSFKPPDVQRPKRGLDPESKALHLVVLVVNDGLSVKTAGGNIAPGCKEVGPGIAFPKSNGAPDLAALRACVEHLVEAIPTEEKGFTITANPLIPFGDVVDVIEVVRTRADGTPLLPDVTFGIPR